MQFTVPPPPVGPQLATVLAGIVARGWPSPVMDDDSVWQRASELVGVLSADSPAGHTLYTLGTVLLSDAPETEATAAALIAANELMTGVMGSFETTEEIMAFTGGMVRALGAALRVVEDEDHRNALFEVPVQGPMLGPADAEPLEYLWQQCALMDVDRTNIEEVLMLCEEFSYESRMVAAGQFIQSRPGVYAAALEYGFHGPKGHIQ